MSEEVVYRRAQLSPAAPAGAADPQAAEDATAYATVAELAAALRVRLTAQNEPGLQACLDAAAVEIDHDLDRDETIPPGSAGYQLAARVNLVRAVEWYKANDAAFGVIGFDDTGALQAPRDGFNRHAYTLTPLKRRWGLA
jgi:hypothetical protein